VITTSRVCLAYAASPGACGARDALDEDWVIWSVVRDGW